MMNRGFRRTNGWYYRLRAVKVWGGVRVRLFARLSDPHLAAVLLATFVALQALPLQAQTTTEVEVPYNWSLNPDDLGAGDKFRLLFLSSTKTDAMSTDIEDYNTFIKNLVAAGHDDIQDHSEGFRVVGCTADVDARDNTGTTGAGVPIYWLNDSRRVADDNADFYDGDWAYEANDKNESGNNGPNTSQTGNFPFTGCGHNGTEAVSSGTSLGLGASSVRVGRPHTSGSDNGPLASGFSTNSTNSRPMYGLSQVFEVAAPTSPGKVLVSEKRLSLTEGGVGSYRVHLNQPPAADVTVTIGGHAGTNVTPNPTSLTFTSSDWHRSQSVTVSAGSDANTTNESFTLTHTATSSDSLFDGITAPSVIVNVDDSEAPDYHIHTIRLPQGLALGAKALPEEEFEVTIIDAAPVLVTN